MKDDREKHIALYFSLEELESLFIALHMVEVKQLAKLEIRAVNVFRERIYYAIEKFAETPEIKEARKNIFFEAIDKYKNLFKTDRIEKEIKEPEPERIKV